MLGGGVMGRAIIEGALRAGTLDPSATFIAEPDDDRRAGLDALGAQTHASADDAVRAALSAEPAPGLTAILLAVKPQVFPTLAVSISPHLGPHPRLVISIMAGVRAAGIGRSLGSSVRVVRAMPNTPARIGQGVTGIAAGPAATPSDLSRVHTLFAAVGPQTIPIDETLMDAFTALAGSGPAYLFLLAEAMERAGVALGFDTPTARAAASQTLRGAAALLDGTDPAALRAAVTSKAGTTAAALASLDRDAVPDAIVRAITAARDRGRELSGD